MVSVDLPVKRGFVGILQDEVLASLDRAETKLLHLRLLSHILEGLILAPQLIEAESGLEVVRKR